MEPKILEEDRDEWIYNSMKKYSNLYMFELEFPADVFEVIDETSICLSGCQPYSKKTEILQLALPPKLFPKDIEEGLCKDRDFQIVSGGYASSSILQIKAIKSSANLETGSLVACTQAGEASVTLYQLGNEDTAVVKEFCKLPLDTVMTSDPKLTYADPKQSPGVIITKESSIFLGTSERSILEWDLNSGATIPMKHDLSPHIPLGGKVTKVKMQDSSTSTILLLGDNGVVLLHDLRSPSPPMSFASSKISSPESETSSSEILYSFDTTSTTLGIIDSCGGYETFDLRNPTPTTPRMLLPLGDGAGASGGGVLREKFNLQFAPTPTSGPHPLFLVSGFDSSVVSVLGQTKGQRPDLDLEIGSPFIHDGHFKRVTGAVWHPSVERLIFSSSVDAMLHAWQYETKDEMRKGKTE